MPIGVKTRIVEAFIKLSKEKRHLNSNLKSIEMRFQVGISITKGSIQVRILLLQKSLANGVGPTQMIN